jgi:hypothetical protein
MTPIRNRCLRNPKACVVPFADNPAAFVCEMHEFSAQKNARISQLMAKVKQLNILQMPGICWHEER